MKFWLVPMVLLFTLLPVVVSCDDTSGIFYSLEQEEKLREGSIKEDITVSSIVAFDIDGADGEELFLAAGNIFDLDSIVGESPSDFVLDQQWKTRYSPPQGKICSSLFVLNDTLHALMYNFAQSPGDSESGVYTLSGDEWSSYTIPGIDEGVFIENVATLSNPPIAYLVGYDKTLKDNRRSYTIYAFDGDSAISVATSLDASGNLDVASNGDTIYLTWGSTLYAGSTPAALTLVAPEGIGTDVLPFLGVHYSRIYSTFFLSTSDGTIWYYNNGWSVESKLNSKPGDLIDYTTADGEFLLVGITGGYMEISGSLDAGDLGKPEKTTDYGNYQTTDLRKAVVHSFFTYDQDSDGTDDYLFALTNGYGLWANRGKEGEKRWNRE